MRKHGARLAILAFCLLVAPTAMAEDRFGIGLKVGTYGLGGDFGIRAIDFVGFRLSVQRLSVSRSEEIDDVDYDGDLKLGGEGVLVDIYPLGGQFRVTAGLYNNRNEVDLVAKPSGPIQIGDTTYPAALVGTLSGTVEFDKIAPYLGIGWGNVSKGHVVGFLFDAGVLRQGAGMIDLESSKGLVSQDDLDAEAEKIEDDISDYELWPVVSVGIAIRF
jgi:hypothetical protein